MIRTRWLAVCAFGLLAGPAAAQTPPGFSAFEGAAPPADLPLLPVPGPNPPPPPFAPGGPVGGYEPGYLYLPEPGPEFATTAPPPDPVWRVSAAAEFAWLSTRALPAALRLTPRDVLGQRIPGLLIPTDGTGGNPFQSGIGLTLSRRLWDRGALEASAFVLPGSPQRIEGFAPGALVYFPDATNSAPMIARFPSGFGGLATAFPSTLSTTFVGADVNYRHALIRTSTARLDVLAGYRFAYLTDELYLGDQAAGGNNAYRLNRLQTETTFNGGQLGLAVGLDHGRWYTDGVVKIAYGGVLTNNTASGAFLFTHPRPDLGWQVSPAVLPTINWKVGYRLSEGAGLFMSYSFQYLNQVSRLGDAFGHCRSLSDLWVQSLGLGVDWRY